MNAKRFVPLLAAGIGVALAIAGCQSGPAEPSAAPISDHAPGAVSGVVPGAAPGGAALPADPAPGPDSAGVDSPAGTGSGSSSGAGSGTDVPGGAPAGAPGAASTCPVDADLLAAALRTGGGDLAAIPDVASLLDLECFDQFATARIVPRGGGGQSSRVLFGYDAAAHAWRPLSAGSAGFCEGFVPDAIATHFTGCG